MTLILNNIIRKYIGIKTPFTKVRKVLEMYEKVKIICKAQINKL